MIDERLIALAAVGIIVVLLVAGYTSPKRAVRKALRGGGDLTTAEQLEAENDRRRTIFEIAGAVLLVVGVVFTYLQLQNTREQLESTEATQLTDRLVKTIQQIGSDRQTEQIGGMYGLRSVTVDAIRDGNPSYLEILDQTISAFIRQHAPCAPCQTNPEARPNDAVQVALFVLGDRENVFDDDRLGNSRQHRMVNLTNVDLRGADLAGLFLAHVDFRGSNLSNADITRANLGGSDLRETVLADIIGEKTVEGEGTKWS